MAAEACNNRAGVPMLFALILASEPAQSATGLATVGAAAVAALASFGAAYLNYRSGRDRLQFDAEKVQMQADILRLTEDVAECRNDRDDLREELSLLRRQMTGVAVLGPAQVVQLGECAPPPPTR